MVDSVSLGMRQTSGGIRTYSLNKPNPLDKSVEYLLICPKLHKETEYSLSFFQENQRFPENDDVPSYGSKGTPSPDFPPCPDQEPICA